MASKVQEIVEKYRRDKGQLVPILQDIQTEYCYLPKAALEEAAKLLDIPISRVYGVATFFKAFSLTPQGRHLVRVCLGTACQVRGAPRLLDRTKDVLKLAPGETSPDMRFSLNTVNCLGCCALGPVMVVDKKYHSNPPTSELQRIVEAAK